MREVCCDILVWLDVRVDRIYEVRSIIIINSCNFLQELAMFQMP